MLGSSPGRLLCVHGAGGGGWEWAIWRRVFEAAGWRVDAPDLRPVAGGPAATGFGDYEAQVRERLAATARPRVLAGASLGGLLAARCAAAADALILVNPLPPAPWHALLPARAWPPLVPWGRDARLAGTRRALPEGDEATVLYAFRRWRDESGAVLRAAQAGLAAPKPDVPALCIASDGDAEVPPAVTGALARAWGARLLHESGGHLAPLLGCDAAAVASRALRFLAGLGAAPSPRG
ncbi:alpha/beta fold hydrolase [Luteimonas huabeiensis]|uniref:alpha/beta fold hydrolase n=1 Tax=Luteimonas huabeiensis TaxID=1244513 RepID=UPI0013644A06|nr:alpha/beta fold hydrolase [Luteimonas huabeiensis]